MSLINHFRRIVLCWTLGFALGFGPVILTAQERLGLMEISDPSEEELDLLPKNLTRWHLGARLLVPTGNGGYLTYNYETQEKTPLGKFLDDDETETVELSAGTHELVVDMGDILSVSRFFCLSFNAGGQISLFGSNTLLDIDSDKWTPLGRTVPFQPETTMDVRFPLADLRFLRVKFDITQPGGLGSIGAMGLLATSQIEFVGIPAAKSSASDIGTGSYQKEREEDIADGADPGEEDATFTENAAGALRFDYGKLYSGSRVTHLSTGDPRLANFLIDDDVLTYYEVPPQENTALFIIRLPVDSQVDYVSMVLESGDATMELWFLNDLPEGLQEDPNLPDTELTRFWKNPGSGDPLLFASNDPESLRQAMLYAQTSDFRMVEVESDFVDSFGDPVVKTVELGEPRVQIPVPLAEANYMVIRWISASPIPMGLRVFEISVMGMVETVEGRTIAYSEAPVAAASEIAALQPTTPPPIQSTPPAETPGPPKDPRLPPLQSVTSPEP